MQDKLDLISIFLDSINKGFGHCVPNKEEYLDKSEPYTNAYVQGYENSQKVVDFCKKHGFECIVCDDEHEDNQYIIVICL